MRRQPNTMRLIRSRHIEQDGVGGTYRQPLSIIRRACTKQSLERVIPWNDKTSKVGQELTTKVEEDEEEVYSNNSQKSVNFRNRGLLFKVVEHGILGKLRSVSV